MAIGTGPQGNRDFTLVVGVLGEATSDLQLTDHIYNFSMKCADTAKFEWDFIDKDDYPIYGGKTNQPGATAGPVNCKCRNFKFKLSSATPGTYHIRVYVH